MGEDYNEGDSHLVGPAFKWALGARTVVALRILRILFAIFVSRALEL